MVDLTDIRELENEFSNLSIVAGNASKALDRAIELQDRVSKIISEIDAEIRAYENEGWKEIFPEIDEQFLTAASEILYNEIEEAARITEEYDDEFFLSKLRLAAFTPGVISITPMGRGQFYVGIHMNEVAGSLSDYIKGVESAREITGAKETHALSSHFWAEKLYAVARQGKKLPERILEKDENGKTRKRRKSAKDHAKDLTHKYWEIMATRLTESGKIAPFWEFLDQGNIPIAGAKGGTPYPMYSPTNFVEKAREKIHEYLTGVGVGADIRYEWGGIEDPRTIKSIENLKKYVERAQKLLDKIEVYIEQVLVLDEDDPAEALQELADALGRDIAELDEKKLLDIAYAIRTHGIDSLNFTAAGRYEVTASGGKRHRIYESVIRRVAATLGYY